MAKRKTPYRSKVKIGVDANGKAINKWIQGSTRAELDEQRRRVIAYYITGEGLEKDRLFGEYAVEWYRVRKQPFVTRATQNAYRVTLNKHILPAFGDRRLRAIRPIDVQEYVNTLKHTSPSTIGLSLVLLKQIFGAAKQDRLIRFDPTDGLIRPEAAPVQAKRALTPEERARLVALFPAHPYGPYLATLYYTGMRPGEVRGLQWGDIDWEKNLIHVQRDVDYSTGKPQLGALKTKSSDRFVPVASELRALLWPLRQAPAAPIFTNPKKGGIMTHYYEQRIWRELMAACGIEDITPHALRHNFITMCWESGLDLALTMKIVGHARFATTREIYTHLSENHLDLARTTLDAMFSPRVAEKLHDGDGTN